MNEEKIIEMLLKHEEDIGYIKENMATKKDLSLISDTLDKLVGLAEKKDQELTISSHDIRNLEDRMEIVEKDIIQMKPAIGMA